MAVVIGVVRLSACRAAEHCVCACRPGPCFEGMTVVAVCRPALLLTGCDPSYLGTSFTFQSLSFLIGKIGVIAAAALGGL